MSLYESRASKGKGMGTAPRGATGIEEMLTALMKLAPTGLVEVGERLVSAGAADGTVHVVLDGRLALVDRHGGRTDTLATVGRGGAVRVPSSAVDFGTAFIATEPATVIELAPALVERLPMTLQGALWRAVALTTTTAAEGLFRGHGAIAGATAELCRVVRQREQRARRSVESPVIRAMMARLPSLPSYAIDLTSKLLADESRANEIVESIKGDPSLAALVLKTVNSSYFGLSTKVSDYYRAFLLLGAMAVYRLVMDSGLRAIMPDTAEGRAIQTRSYLVSTIATDIAMRCRGVEAQLATTVGLLHEIGASIALVFRDREPGLAPFLDLVDSAKLGADVLAAWGLPDRVYRAIDRQHLPEVLPPHVLPPEDGPMIGVLYVSRALADMLLEAGDTAVSRAYLHEHLCALGLTDVTCESLLQEHVVPALVRQARHLPRHVQEAVPALGGGREP